MPAPEGSVRLSGTAVGHLGNVNRRLGPVIVVNGGNVAPAVARRVSHTLSSRRLVGMGLPTNAGRRHSIVNTRLTTTTGTSLIRSVKHVTLLLHGGPGTGPGLSGLTHRTR